MKRLLLIGLAVAVLLLLSASPAFARGYKEQGTVTSTSKTGGAVSACPSPGTCITVPAVSQP